MEYPSDRAQVFVDGTEACQAIFRPDSGPTNLTKRTGDWEDGGGERLQLLVENMGRMTFGSACCPHYAVPSMPFGSACCPLLMMMSFGSACCPLLRITDVLTLHAWRPC